MDIKVYYIVGTIGDPTRLQGYDKLNAHGLTPS